MLCARGPLYSAAILWRKQLLTELRPHSCQLDIEVLTAAQAIDLRPAGTRSLGAGTFKAYTAIRRRVPFLEHDLETTPDINALAALIQSGEMLGEVASAVKMPWPVAPPQDSPTRPGLWRPPGIYRPPAGAP